MHRKYDREEGLRQLLGLISTLEEEDLPEGFEQRLHLRLQQECRETEAGISGKGVYTSWSIKWVKWGAGLAAAIALMFSIYMVKPLGFLNQSHDENLYGYYKSPGLDSAPEEELSEGKMQPAETKSDRSIKYGFDSGQGENNTQSAALPSEIYLYLSESGEILEKISSIADDLNMKTIDKQADKIILQVPEVMQTDTLIERLSELGRMEPSGHIGSENTITIQVIVE